MKKGHWILICVVCLLVWGSALAEDKEDGKSKSKQSEKKKVKDKKEELKLEDLMPEKSPFGPSASSTAFSYDGKYGAYLYRPYKERRHGSDLHIYDVAKDDVVRITWPSVMAEFQKSAREVVEDRIEKAKKSKGKSKSDDDEEDKDEEGDEKIEDDEDVDEEEDKDDDVQDGEDSDKDDEDEDDEEQLKRRGDWVDDKDADAEKAPRYGGISRYAWSPVANEVLLETEGEIYRYDVAAEKLTRLTLTRDRESGVRWLEDGSGYTYWRDGAVFRNVFGCEIDRQLDPKLPNGDTMYNCSVSPDGKRVAILTSKQTKEGEASKVEIAKYRDRLMKSQEVSRHVSDDPLSVYEYRVYVRELSEGNDEKDELTEVFKFEKHMPDDTLSWATWSPDSTKVAFLTFEQDPSLVKIYEVEVGEAGSEDDSNEADEKLEEGEKGKKEKDEGESDDGEDDDEDEEADSEESDPNSVGKAKEIYRFLHHGGPNTPKMMRVYYLADNKRIVYLSEQTGFRHLHVLDPLYETFKSLTSGAYEVYPINISRDRKWVFVEATKEHPSRRDIYRVSTSSGKMVRLTKERGVHSDAAVSEDGTRLLANLVSYKSLKELRFVDIAAKKRKTLTDSHPEKAAEFARHSPQFFDYENRHGHKIYGMMFKPDNWSKKDKRPVLIYFYGGPLGTRKMVTDGSFSSYNYGFPYYMAKKHGYVTCTIDTRGNSGYAGVFEKANFGQVGQPQVEDLVDGVKLLVADYGVDPNKVAIHGWSFGGFQTQMCMYTEPDVFNVGIAGAGPTEWENYNSWYTRHTIGKSEPGKATLKEFSLLPLAKNLKGHLLLVHGIEDSNVLYQDTIRVYRELLKAGKETLVELFIDPTGGHGLGGDVKTLSRYRKYEQFLLRTVGPHEVPAKVAKKKAKK